MAVISIPSTATEQPTESQTLGNAGSATIQRAFKDSYGTLKTLADSIARNDSLGNAKGDIIKAYNLRRCPAGQGILTFSLAPYDKDTDPETQEEAQVALLETWSLKSVRNDVSLFAYCGPSEGNNPQRTHLELWLKETDAELADDDKYRKNDEDTEGTELTTADAAVAAKFRKGYDSVIRFYPLLTKKRVYSAPPATVYENLNKIDTPSVDSTAKEEESPGNLSAIISAHSWLKVQDDIDKESDGTFTRTESWMGVLTSERTWDSDFYGSNAWSMPYGGGGGNGGGGNSNS